MSAARFSSAASFSDSDSLIAQAERCRSLGQTFRDFSLRRRMFELAMDYEELAEEALRHEGMSIQIGSREQSWHNSWHKSWDESWNG